MLRRLSLYSCAHILLGGLCVFAQAPPAAPFPSGFSVPKISEPAPGEETVSAEEAKARVRAAQDALLAAQQRAAEYTLRAAYEAALRKHGVTRDCDLAECLDTTGGPGPDIATGVARDFYGRNFGPVQQSWFALQTRKTPVRKADLDAFAAGIGKVKEQEAGIRSLMEKDCDATARLRALQLKQDRLRERAERIDHRLYDLEILDEGNASDRFAALEPLSQESEKLRVEMEKIEKEKRALYRSYRAGTVAVRLGERNPPPETVPIPEVPPEEENPKGEGENR